MRAGGGPRVGSLGFEGASFAYCVAHAAGGTAVAADGEEAEPLAEAFFNLAGAAESSEGNAAILGSGDNFLDGDFDGRVAEGALDAISITVNKQLIPDDPKPPLRPSGIRIGTPAATTRGLGEEDMEQLAAWIVQALQNAEDGPKLDSLRREVEALCSRHPVPGI